MKTQRSYKIFLAVYIFIVQVAVVAFSDEAHSLSADHDDCYATELAAASPWNKQYLIDFVRGLYPTGGSNYIEALTKAFAFFHNSKTNEEKRKLPN